MTFNQLTSTAYRIKSFVNHSFFNTESYKNYLEPIVELYHPNTSLLHNMAKIEYIHLERFDVTNLYLKPNKNWKGFKAGQFIQLGFHINGILYQRIFSISSSEQLFTKKGLIRVSIQKQTMGKVTSFVLDSLQHNTYLQISPAMGIFTLESDSNEPVLFVAGGVGITPILSMLSGVLNSNQQYTLMYYASKDKPHLFLEELTLLASTNTNLNIQIIDTEKMGLFSVEHLNEFSPDFINRKIYLCGPQAMDKHVRVVLEKEGFKQENLLAESFTAHVFSTKNTEIKDVKISFDNSNKEFLVKNDKTILELLESQNEQPKYGCRMGICNQCTCKKTSGLVYNIQTKKVSDSGKEFIKICSSVPLGDITLAL